MVNIGFHSIPVSLGGLVVTMPMVYTEDGEEDGEEDGDGILDRTIPDTSTSSKVSAGLLDTLPSSSMS